MKKLLTRAAVAAFGCLIGVGVPLGVGVAGAQTVPTVSGLSPNSLPQGASAQSVTISGANFESGAVVTSHAGITATVSSLSATQVNALFDVSPSVAPGAYNVFVSNPGGGHAGECAGCLTVTTGSIPTITSLSPNTFAPGSQGQSVTMTGTNFQPGARVSSHPGINATVTTFVGPTQMNLSLSIGASVPSGLYDVFVTNPDGVTARCINCLNVSGTTGGGPGGGGGSTPGSGVFVGMASVADGSGYWLVNAGGAVFAFGSAVNFGSMAGQHLNAPITHIVATPDSLGYWLVAADGGTFSFGDAGFFGSMGGQALNAPVVDIAPTPDGNGYWLVASDGGIFAFGDANFQGSMGGKPLNQPVVGMAADSQTGGYWLVASDGGIFAFNAPFYGSTGAIHLNKPVNGMSTTVDGQGYWFVASDGGIFNYGDAAFLGSTGALTLNAPIVGMAPDYTTGGYWLVGSDGGIFSYGAPFYGSGA